jgi:hypothetical protein
MMGKRFAFEKPSMLVRKVAECRTMATRSPGLQCPQGMYRGLTDVAVKVI